MEVDHFQRVESIYTHWDGYPSHHGPLLLGYWDTAEKVRDLIALGDLSILNKELGQAHDFDAPYDDLESRDWCKAYGRDRGEKLTEADVHGMDEWPDCGQEYEYLFTLRGEWVWREAIYTKMTSTEFTRGWTPWQPLTPDACMDEDAKAASLVVPEPAF